MAEVITALVDLVTGAFDDSGRDPDGVRYVRLAMPRNPDALREKYSGDPLNPFTAKTAQEIADTITARQTAAAQVTSRQKDILATIAWAVRRSNVTAWNALTLAQKKSTVLAEADNWRDLRVFIEQNL